MGYVFSAACIFAVYLLERVSTLYLHLLFSMISPTLLIYNVSTLEHKPQPSLTYDKRVGDCNTSVKTVEWSYFIYYLHEIGQLSNGLSNYTENVIGVILSIVSISYKTCIIFLFNRFSKQRNRQIDKQTVPI